MQINDEQVPGSVVDRVHRAWDQLLSGDVELAIVMLQGVEPECRTYSTFYVVQASALLSKQDLAGALSSAERALELTPDSPHARLIAELAHERLRLAASALERPQTQPDRPRTTLAALLDPVTELEAPPAQFDIDRTADELTRERPLVRAIPEPEQIQAAQLPDPEGAPALVSETLAEIMIRQGKLSDAKKVYIQLARSQPERYAHFAAKIEAIDKLLLGTSIAPETTTSEATDNDPVA